MINPAFEPSLHVKLDILAILKCFSHLTHILIQVRLFLIQRSSYYCITLWPLSKAFLSVVFKLFWHVSLCFRYAETSSIIFLFKFSSYYYPVFLVISVIKHHRRGSNMMTVLCVKTFFLYSNSKAWPSLKIYKSMDCGHTYKKQILLAKSGRIFPGMGGNLKNEKKSIGHI